MRALVYSILIVLISLLVSSAQIKKDHSGQNITCETCHVCRVPTKDDPCLRACPRLLMIKQFPSPETGPDVVVMDDLTDRYMPGVFPHKLHAQMSEMTGGCIACHHYNTLGPILNCKECHSIKRKREDITKPDLKGAYHQQCLNCHRQWSHKTECVSCHEKKNGNTGLSVAQLISRFKNKSHPEVNKPDVIVYDTNYDKGKLVTFYHKEHSTLFGLKCIDCHNNENCIRCHDLQKKNKEQISGFDLPVKVQVSKEERHLKCFGCHANNKCSFCHSNEKMKPFDHKLRTGWALNRFHKKLSCIKCHGNKKSFTKLNSNCNNCHSGWTPETFNHKITGLVLDDNHSDIDCEECHLNRDFGNKPVCDNCHDDKNWPENKPGRMVE